MIQKIKSHLVLRLHYYILLALMVGMLYFVFVKTYSRLHDVFGSDSDRYIVLYIVALAYFVAIRVQLIIHELGHMVFGIFNGYEFIMLRVGTSMFIKENGRIRRKHYKVIGAAGQCMMLPPEDVSPKQLKMFLLGGGVFNLIAVPLFMLLSLLVSNQPYLYLLATSLYAVGLLIAVTNLVPLVVNGQPNDGNMLVRMLKNERYRRMARILTRIEAAHLTGTRFKDMPTEWFDFCENPNLNDISDCLSTLYAGCYYGDKGDYVKTTEIYENLLEHGKGLGYLVANDIKCSLLFMELIGSCRKDVINGYYTKDLVKYIKMTDCYPARKRIMYAYYLLFEKNNAKATKELASFEKMMKNYPIASVVELERELIKKISAKSVAQ